jgi:hypothetical protein
MLKIIKVGSVALNVSRMNQVSIKAEAVKDTDIPDYKLSVWFSGEQNSMTYIIRPYVTCHPQVLAAIDNYINNIFPKEVFCGDPCSDEYLDIDEKISNIAKDALKNMETTNERETLNLRYHDGV